MVWENKPNLKETTVNHFALRHYWWIEVYTCSEHSESVKQYARIVRASLISSLFNLPGMTAYPTVILQRFNLLCLAWKIKKKVIFNSCLNLCNFLNFFAFGYSCFMFHDCPLAGNKRHLFEIFLLFNSITPAVTACNAGVFKKT